MALSVCDQVCALAEPMVNVCHMRYARADCMLVQVAGSAGNAVG